MSRIKPLTNIKIEIIHDAFVDAFSEYETPVDISMDQLHEMLVTRSYQPDFSRGYFREDRLAGFVLVGYREEAGSRMFYDAGTGIRKEFQKQGMGNALLESVMAGMKQERINTFLLEVLENNAAARELYKKHGFKETRKFSCFRFSLEGRPSEKGHIRFAESQKLCNHPEKLCGFVPSWQNANPSVVNAGNHVKKFDIDYLGKSAGYLIINRKNGNIMQLGLERNYRTLAVLDEIVKAAGRLCEGETMKLLNIEVESEIDRLLKEYGMDNFVNQYEMELSGGN